MDKASRERAPQYRFLGYRPFIDALILACALLGVLVVVHLWVQQGRGFQGGCLGVSDLSAPSSSSGSSIDCHSVVNSAAGSLLGVSNILLGFLFYLVLTGMSLVVTYRAGGRRLKQARAVLVTGGFLYTLYLVYYQSFVIGKYCVLCMCSAVLITVIFALHLIDFFTESKNTNDMNVSSAPSNRSRRILMQSVAALLVFLLAGADIMYFKGADGGSKRAPATTAQAERTSGGNSGAGGACGYVQEADSVENFEDLVQFSDPIKGNPEASVTVIEYLDPTCPHCKELHEHMGEVIEAKKEKARFVYKLFPLRRASFPPILALKAAAKKGKFHEMLDRQFDTQNQGFTLKRLRQMASEMGMDPNKMEQKMRSKALIKGIMKERKSASALGVDSTPTVFINGRMVGPYSRTSSCLKTLIDRAAEKREG